MSNNSKPINIGPLKGYYVIVGKNGIIHYYTLSCQKKTCIDKFLDGGTLDWRNAKKLGWQCLKVNVTFHPC